MKKIVFLLFILFIHCEIPKQGSLKLTNNSGENVYYNIVLSNDNVMLTKISEFSPKTPPFPLLKEGEDVVLNFEDYEKYSIALVDVYAIRKIENSDSLAVNLLTLSVQDMYGIWFVTIPELSE